MSGSAVLLLSGGVDSAYMLLRCRPRIALFVDYGQPAAEPERDAADALARRFGITLAAMTVRGVPLGDMQTESDAFVVPGRNTYLWALACSLCDPGEDVVLGCAPYDNADYVDCRLEYLEKLDSAAAVVGLGGIVVSSANREMRVAALRQSGLLDLTYSCYREAKCGECPSCLQ